MVRLPRRRATTPAGSHAEYVEPPEVHERNLWIGARVIAGTTILFFAAFVFAYFYLRSLNNSDQWRPSGVDPPQRYGLAIVLLFVISASLLAYAAWAARERRGWTVLFVVFVLLTMCWVEILFAEGVRNRGAEEATVPAGLADAAFYWSLLAGIGVLTWAILYLF